MVFSQSGNSIVIILLLIGMITGGVLIEKKINPNPSGQPVPSASVETEEKSPAVVLSLIDKNTSSLKEGDNLAVEVMLSTKEPVNLISAKIDYPKDLLKVSSLDDLKGTGPISLWVTKSDFPEEGRIELIGGIPTPGVNTEGKRTAFARINFQLKSKLAGKSFTIALKEAVLYSNADNQPLKELTLQSISQETTSAPTNPSSNPEMSPNASPKDNNKKGSLVLSPALLQTSSSCTFDINLQYDTDGSDFFGIDALLTIDPRFIKPIKIVRGDNPPDALYAPQLAFNKDTVTIAYIAPKNRSYQKKGSLGKITFQVNDQAASGLTAVKIKRNPNKKNDLTDSNIVYSLQEDILSSTSNTIISIVKGSCNNPKTYEELPRR